MCHFWLVILANVFVATRDEQIFTQRKKTEVEEIYQKAQPDLHEMTY